MITLRPTVIVIACGLATAFPCVASSFDVTCWQRASQRYGINALELAAHACVESRLRPSARNVNANGTEDLNVMQINTAHLPRLAKYGITRDALAHDACLSINVGAWLLADLKTRYGDTWEATGAYNAACTKLKGADCQKARRRYAWRVFSAMTRLRNTGHC